MSLSSSYDDTTSSPLASPRQSYKESSSPLSSPRNGNNKNSDEDSSGALNKSSSTSDLKSEPPTSTAELDITTTTNTSGTSNNNNSATTTTTTTTGTSNNSSKLRHTRSKAASVFGGIGEHLKAIRKQFTTEADQILHKSKLKRHPTIAGSRLSRSSSGSQVLQSFSGSSASNSSMLSMDDSIVNYNYNGSDNITTSPRGQAQQQQQEEQPVIERTFAYKYDEEEATEILANSLPKYLRCQKFLSFLKNDLSLKEQRLRRSTIKELYFTELTYISVLDLGYNGRHIIIIVVIIHITIDTNIKWENT